MNTTSQVAFLLGLAAAVTCAHAANVVLPAAADNTLFQNSAGTLSNGSGSHFFVGTSAIGGARRGLLQFDESGIPVGAFVASAELSLSLDRPEIGPFQQVAIHRVTQSWGEASSNADSPFNGGGGGAPAMVGDATWAHRFFATTNWSTPGGDFDSLATQSFTPPDKAGLVSTGPSAALAADVQAWRLNPAGNFGWLLKAADESVLSTAQRYGSSENAAESERPHLVVTYQIAGDATGDDFVNLDDFTVLAANFGSIGRSFTEGDFTFDTSVNLDDFTVLAANFGMTAADVASRAAVPEPASIVLAVGCLLPLARKRRLRCRGFGG